MAAVGPLRALHPSPDFVSDAIRATGDYYEANILDEVARRLPAAGTVVDGGAMIGNHSVYLAHVPGLTIHAFEPVPDNLTLLARNVAEWPNVVVHPQALSDRFEQLRMRVEPGNMGHALIEPDGGLQVSAVPLDLFNLHDVVLMKLDVEGHERRALEGARRTLERWHPLLLVEDWPQNLPGYLDRIGYQLERAWPDQQTYLYRWAES